MALKGTLNSIDISNLKSIFVTKDEFEDRLGSFRNEVFNRLDRVLKELLNIREENAIFKAKIDDHDERIEVLEKVHPQGRHQ